MANYTFTLSDLITENFPDLNMTDTDALIAAGTKVCFYPNTLALIKPEIREQFVSMIVTHYLFNEIGQETVPAWRHFMNETIYSNYDYINLLLENIEMSLNDSKITEKTTYTSDTIRNIWNTQNIVGNSKDEYSELFNHSANSFLNGTTALTGESNSNTTGENKNHSEGFTEGNDSNKHNDHSVFEKTGEEHQTSPGNVTVKQEGKVSTTDTGDSTRKADNKESSDRETTNVNGEEDAWTGASDTPEGKLSNVLSLKYLTNASMSHSDATTNTSKEKQSGSSGHEEESTNNNISITEYGKGDDAYITTTEDNQDNTLSFIERKDKTENGSTDESTHGSSYEDDSKTDTTQTNTTTNTENGKSETTTKDDSEDKRTTTNENNRTDDIKDEGKTTDNTVSETNRSIVRMTQLSYMKLTPYAKKLWNIFDDNFMLLW